MSDGDSNTPTEIVIVRRKCDGDHDDHHGGVWKVAFADFMTAMMAFFLVLWIVNSTTKQTRSSLARYFNPIRLSDTTPARKGLNEPREVDFDASATENQSRDAHASPEKPIELSAKSVALGKDQPKSNAAMTEIRGGPKAGETQDGFKDPFAGALTARHDQSELKGLDAEARSLMREIERRLGSERPVKAENSLQVSKVSEGILISLTEGSDLGSFTIGSSQPDERLLRVLAAIADVLKSTIGDVVIRGHTDGRPYRSGKSDNWALSFARAQSAFFGLVRSGLDERRIERVEGHADRQLKNRQVPQAPENRRIEILLRRPTSRP